MVASPINIMNIANFSEGFPPKAYTVINGVKAHAKADQAIITSENTLSVPVNAIIRATTVTNTVDSLVIRYEVFL